MLSVQGTFDSATQGKAFMNERLVSRGRDGAVAGEGSRGQVCCIEEDPEQVLVELDDGLVSVSAVELPCSTLCGFQTVPKSESERNRGHTTDGIDVTDILPKELKPCKALPQYHS